MYEVLSVDERVKLWEEACAEGEEGCALRFAMKVEDLCFRRLRGIEASAKSLSIQNPKPTVTSESNIVDLLKRT